MTRPKVDQFWFNVLCTGRILEDSHIGFGSSVTKKLIHDEFKRIFPTETRTDLGWFYRRTHEIFGKLTTHDTTDGGVRVMKIDLPSLEIAKVKFRSFVNDPGMRFDQ